MYLIAKMDRAISTDYRRRRGIVIIHSIDYSSGAKICSHRTEIKIHVYLLSQKHE